MLWLGTPRMPFREPFADGVRMERSCPGNVCEIPGLGDSDPCIDPFIVPESTALPRDVLRYRGKGIADHCARCDGCSLRFIFAPAPSCILK
jgi:hypothetical protein